MRAVVLGAFILAASACGDRMAREVADALSAEQPSPEIVPLMQNAALPFRYPPSLWAQRVQGDVILHLFVDTAGVPVADSTRIAESSGIPLLDSAALLGAPLLRFTPARRNDAPMAVAVLFPVLFRHPDAPPLPGDSGRVPPPDRRPDSP
jgi:TonB family protein